MTTTQKKRASALDRLAEVEADAHAALKKLDQARHDRQAFIAGVETLDAELRRLARTEPEQFGPDGAPKLKSRAAELQAELKRAAESNRWADLIAGAEHAVEVAQRALAQHRADHAIELATLEYRRGEELLAKLGPHADQILGVLAELDTVRTRLMAIAASCGGRLDGRDIAVDPRLAQLTQLLAEHPSLAAPRSRSLTPFEGESPPALRSVHGGWIDGGHIADNYGEQPPRLEPGR